MSQQDVLSFRCIHRHTAEAHPQCYQRFLSGEKMSDLQPGIPKRPRTAKILLLDIETLPGEYYAFSPKVEYLSPDKQIKGWSISCFAARWLFDNETMGRRVTAQEAFDRQDRSILGEVWKLMDEAQIVVTQNGIAFDIPSLFTKFVENGIKPPLRFQNVDTLKTARKVFRFDYNRLDQLGERFGIGKKLDMSFLDWKKCLSNDFSAEQHLDHMLDYCKRDVAPLLEDVYLNMLPYMTNHPNLSVYSLLDNEVCPRCECESLVWGNKPYATSQGLWDSWRCPSCGASGRGTGKKHRLKKTTLV